MKRLALIAASLFLLANCPDPAVAHVYKKIGPNICKANWQTVEGNEKQIRCMANWFGVNADFSVSVARCESGLRYNAVSPSGTYRGTWQWGPTWENSARPHMLPNMPNTTPFDGRRATIVTMRYVKHYGWGAWSCA